jgi:tetratricopeptide (TPR) repeat protein
MPRIFPILPNVTCPIRRFAINLLFREIFKNFEKLSAIIQRDGNYKLQTFTMARKKRQVPEQFNTPVQTADKPKTVYQDEFQTGVNKRVEDLGKRFEGKGRNLLYGLAALAVLAVLVGIFFAWNRRSDAAAQTALGKAIETAQAQVSASPPPAGFTGKTFKTERERSEAAINEFQTVVDKFGGAVEDKAKYFIAVNRLRIDRNQAIQELEGLSNTNGEIGSLSKFALAQAKVDDGKLDEAAAIYNELAGLSNPILAKETIRFELAQVYQKQGKTTEAADIYYEIAKTASEAKGSDDKPIPMSQTAREAKDKLEEINPDRAKEIVEPAPETPPGGMQLGM